MYLSSSYTAQPAASAKVAEVKLSQSLKALSPIEVRLAGKLTLVKPQSLKALPPIEVRLVQLDKLTFVNLLHSSKALLPIEVRLVQLDKSTLVNFLQ